MKKLYATLLCLAVVGFVIVGNPKAGHSDNVIPQAGKTGAPNEGTCAASGCHTNSSGGSGNVAIVYSGGTTYKADSTYAITVTVTDATATRFGFELTALNASNAKAGTLAITNTATQSMPTAGGVTGRQYIAHHNASTSNTWTFNWTAPSSDVGDVTFYYAGNGGNHNGSATGDHVYLGSTAINFEAVINGIKPMGSMSSFVLQNPTSDMFNLSYALAHDAAVSLDVFDATGKLVANLAQGNSSAGEHHLNQPTNGLAAGMYVLRINVNGATQSQKILVL